MQIHLTHIKKMKDILKREFPNEYAIKIVEKLCEKGITLSRQQVYNFFNDISVSHRNDIINASIELIQEARIEREKMEQWINDNL